MHTFHSSKSFVARLARLARIARINRGLLRCIRGILLYRRLSWVDRHEVAVVVAFDAFVGRKVDGVSSTEAWGRRGTAEDRGLGVDVTL